MSRETPPPSVYLFKVRRKLSSLLIAHLKAEDWVLYPPLLSSTDSKVAATARHFVDEMGGLAQAYSVLSSGGTHSASNPTGSATSGRVGGIIEALTNRIVRENQELYPLLEQIERAA